MTADAPAARRSWRLWLCAALALAVWQLSAGLQFADPASAHRGRLALAVTTLTAACWLLEAMPLAAASLLPLALLPLLAVQPVGEVAAAYAHPILWLFFGGFVLALAIERCGLHRRLALRVIALLGLDARRLVLGFLAAALLLSMWINNTAVALMLLPIGMALSRRVQDEGVLDATAGRRFGLCLMLAIAYGSSLGGMATPIGTAPNLLFFSSWNQLVQRGAPPLSFLQWMLAFAPFALGFGLIAWLMLVRVVFPLPALPRQALPRSAPSLPAARAGGGVGAALLAEVRTLPRMTSGERRVLLLFGAAVLLWVTRADVNLDGERVLHGWAWHLGLGRHVDDGTVAVLIAILAFLVPSAGRGSPRLMDWAAARAMPYEILLLLGGGVAIAGAFSATGLSMALGGAAAPALQSLPPWLAIAATCCLLTCLTEVTSNTAITAIMLPVLSATALNAQIDPRLLLLPATISASCAFMFPIATPPNAVVFASGQVTFGQMARAGVLLNLLGVVLVTALMWLWVVPLLGIAPDGPAPAWVLDSVPRTPQMGPR